MSELQGTDLLYQLDDKPPLPRALIAGVTHLLAIFVPMVTPALIVSAAMGLSPESTAYLVSMAMIASGAGTWIQVHRYGLVGSGLLSIQSVNFSFVTVMATLGTDMKAEGLSEDMILSSLMGVSFMGAFLVVGSAFILPYLRHIITPTVSGIVVLMIGFSLIQVGIMDFGGGIAARENGEFGDLTHIGLASLVMLVVVACNSLRFPYLRMCGIAVGILTGYLVAALSGLVDFSVLHHLPPFTVPQFFKFGFSFNFQHFIVVGVIYLLSVLEAVGDITATAMVSCQSIDDEKFRQRLKGGVLADGLVSVLATALGSLPLTTFSQNNGVIQMTGVASRYVGHVIAILLLLLGLFPATGYVFTTIPASVLGGAMILMFSTIVMAGIRIIVAGGLNRRESMIIISSLGLGLGVSYEPSLFAAFPISLVALTANPVCVGGLTAIILNLLIPRFNSSLV